VAAGIFLLGDRMIAVLFDPKYMEALHVLWIAAAFTVLNAVSFPLGLVVEAVEKVEIHLYAKIFSIYNLAGNLLVIHTLGIEGIALVTSSAVLFKNLYTFIRIRKWVRFSIDGKAFLKILMNTGVMCIPLYFLRDAAQNIPGLFFSVLAGMLLYALCSMLNRVFSPWERGQLQRLIPGGKFPF
jgi:O-antigen/teichoic acid export membrane protein